MDYNELLSRHDVRPTSVRVLIYKVMQEYHNTFSLSDLEAALDSVDKSSIFRTLNVFVEHHLLHKIEDGDGVTQYCLCHNAHVCDVEELHCHFYCERCRKTFCLDKIHIPVVKCPDGFELHQVDYLLKGLCPACSAKA